MSRIQGLPGSNCWFLDYFFILLCRNPLSFVRKRCLIGKTLRGALRSIPASDRESMEEDRKGEALNDKGGNYNM